jgi:hypothetical protein
MLAAPLTDQDLLALDERLDSVREELLRPTAASASLACFGPIRQGESFVGWRIDSMRRDGASLLIVLVHGDGSQVELELCPSVMQNLHTPFPVGEGGLYYRPIPFPFARIEPLCQVLVRLLRSSLRGRPLRQALTVWARACRAEEETG